MRAPTRSRDRFRLGLLESGQQSRHCPVRRYSSGRFGIGRGAGATPAPTPFQGPLAGVEFGQAVLQRADRRARLDRIPHAPDAVVHLCEFAAIARLLGVARDRQLVPLSIKPARKLPT